MKYGLMIAAFLIGLLIAESAEARWRLFGRRRGNVRATVTNRSSAIWGDATTDQQRCQREAEYMARYQIRGHVGPNIGAFEGCGWSGASRYGTPTCVPRGRMTLTGDGAAQDVNGRWYRVRSWR